MLWIALILGWSIIISILVYSLHCGISPTPSSYAIKEKLNSKLPLGEGPILELGCGFGGIAVHLAKNFPLKNVLAYELSPFPYIISKLRSYRYPNLTIKRIDFFQVEHTQAALIYCYLYRRGMEKLEEKWLKELNNTLVVTNTFALPKTEATKVYELSDIFRTKLYVYEMGCLGRMSPAINIPAKNQAITRSTKVRRT